MARLRSVSSDIVEGVMAGDREALGKLFELTYNYVVGFLVPRATERGYAEEAAMETYKLLMVRPDVYRDQGKIHQWLCGAAWHRLLKIERRERLRIGLPLSNHLPDRSSPERIVLERLADDRMRCTISNLPSYPATVLLLRFYYGLKPVQIAKIIGEPQRQVTTASYNGLKRLREQIRSRSEFDQRPDEDPGKAQQKRSKRGKQISFVPPDHNDGL